MAWYYYVITFVVAYFYVGTTTAKYVYYKHELDHEEIPDGLLPTAFFAWFVLAAVEPRWLKGVFYPSLWMWPRFAAEYPEIKRARELDEEVARDYRKSKNRRSREHGNLEKRTESVREQIQHDRQMAAKQKELETLEKQLIVGPEKALESGIIEDYESTDEADIEVVYDKWCFSCQRGFDNDELYVHFDHNHRRWEHAR